MAQPVADFKARRPGVGEDSEQQKEGGGGALQHNKVEGERSLEHQVDGEMSLEQKGEGEKYLEVEVQRLSEEVNKYKAEAEQLKKQVEEEKMISKGLQDNLMKEKKYSKGLEGTIQDFCEVFKDFMNEKEKRTMDESQNKPGYGRLFFKLIYDIAVKNQNQLDYFLEKNNIDVKLDNGGATIHTIFTEDDYTGGHFQRSFRVAESQYYRFSRRKDMKHIIKVEEIRNQALEEKFMKRKRQLEKKGNVSVRLMFHGSPTENYMKIAEEGFNLNIKTNGRHYGDGVYVTEQPEVAFNYNKGDGTAVMLCQVLFSDQQPVYHHDSRMWALVVENACDVLPCYVIHTTG